MERALMDHLYPNEVITTSGQMTLGVTTIIARTPVPGVFR